MTEPASRPDLSTEVAIAVRNLLPGLRRHAALAKLQIAAALGITIAVACWSVTTGTAGDERWKFGLFAMIAAIAVTGWAYGAMIRRQESMTMPVLAAAVGLSYSKVAKDFLNALPQRLLPKSRVRTAEDFVQARLGAHLIEMAEVKVETGGKNSRTLFAGLVARFPNQLAMPAFFVAREDKTRPGMFFGGELSTDGLYHLRNVIGGGGASYGIWTSWSVQKEPAALAPVVEKVTRIEDLIGRGTQLYAATCDGTVMHVALTHSRNLFRIGGLFPDEADVFADVQTAMQDLSVPLTLAKALIETEEIAVVRP